MNSSDVLDLATTDRLAGALAGRLKTEPPTRRWPQSQRSAVFELLGDIATRLDPDHVSYLIYFEGWQELGALRLRSAIVCRHADEVWEEGSEPLCLITEDFSDGLFLDYTDSAQVQGGDEYELWTWGAFEPTATRARS